MPARAWPMGCDEARAPARGDDAQARAHGDEGSPVGGSTTGPGPRVVAVRVYVRTGRGDVECTVPSCLSVAALKEHVLSAAGAPAARRHCVWLRFGSEALQDQHTLAHYRIVDGTILSLAVRVRGGGVCMSAPAAASHPQLPPPAGAGEPRLWENAERAVAGEPDRAEHSRDAAGGLEPSCAMEGALISVLREWKLTDAMDNLTRNGVISMERLRDVSIEEVKELGLPFATAKVFRRLILHLNPICEPIADINADSVSIPSAPAKKHNIGAPAYGLPKQDNEKENHEDPVKEHPRKTSSTEGRSRAKGRSQSRPVARSSSDSESQSSKSDGSNEDSDEDDAEKAIDAIVKSLPRKIRKKMEQDEDCPPELAKILKLQAKRKKKSKSRKDSRESSNDSRTGPLRCKKGDVLRVGGDEEAVERAFEESDANFAPHMSVYLGQSGTVLEVDDESIQLKHEDGEKLWWAYGAVTAPSSQSKSIKRAEGKPKSRWEKVFARYSKFWRRVARMAALSTLPGDLMLEMELEFFQKGTIKTLTDAHWDIDGPITRIVLHGVRNFKVIRSVTDAPRPILMSCRSTLTICRDLKNNRKQLLNRTQTPKSKSADCWS